MCKGSVDLHFRGVYPVRLNLSLPLSGSYIYPLCNCVCYILGVFLKKSFVTIKEPLRFIGRGRETHSPCGIDPPKSTLHPCCTDAQASQDSPHEHHERRAQIEEWLRLSDRELLPCLYIPCWSSIEHQQLRMYLRLRGRERIICYFHAILSTPSLIKPAALRRISSYHHNTARFASPRNSRQQFDEPPSFVPQLYGLRAAPCKMMQLRCTLSSFARRVLRRDKMLVDSSLSCASFTSESYVRVIRVLRAFGSARKLA